MSPWTENETRPQAERKTLLPPDFQEAFSVDTGAMAIVLKEGAHMHGVRKASLSIMFGIAFMAVFCFEASASGGQEGRSIREVQGFDGVSLETRGVLIVTQGDRETLEIEAPSSDLPEIVTEVRGGMLHIGRNEARHLFEFAAPVFRLTMKNIAALEAHSSGRISAPAIRADSLRVLISSSGGVAIDSLNAGSLEVRVSSSGSFRAAGSVNLLDLVLSSSGDFAGGDLASGTATVRASSSGTATLRFRDSLRAEVTSSGDVRYYGSPERANGRVTSSGRLVRLGG
jgi:hypothetical protein